MSESEDDPRLRSGSIEASHSAHEGGRPAELRDQALPELLKQISEQTATLVRKEMELAKAEMTVKGKRIGIGAGALGGAGLIGLFAFGALTAFFIRALDHAVADWLAALIVAVVYAMIAGAAALLGKRKVQQGSPPVPKRAIDSTKEDVEWTKSRAKQAQK